MNLRSSGLTLRKWIESDAEDLYKLAKNPNIGPAAGWPVHQSIEDSLEVIKTLYCRDEAYAVLLDDELIGCVELLVYPNGNHYWGVGSAELGYWIGEEYWGNNYAAEASWILIEMAFYNLNIKKIYATFKKENIQSKRVLEKLGFKYFGVLNNINYSGEVFTEVVMLLEGVDL